MRQRVGVDPQPVVPLLRHRAGRTRLRPGDQGDGLRPDRTASIARGPLVPRILELQTSQNTGALWGLGAGLPGSSLIFAGLSVVAAIVICYWLFFLGAASSRVLTVALGLIMAGALGNCYDRLVFGHVRDFVHFHVDPIGFDCAIFNFADNMLVAGALTLVLYAMRPEEAAPPDEIRPVAARVRPRGDRLAGRPDRASETPADDLRTAHTS